MPKKITKYALFLAERGLTQTDVHNGTNIPISTINRFTRGLVACRSGGNMTMRTLRRLCKFHGCTPNDILPHEEWITKNQSKNSK